DAYNYQRNLIVRLIRFLSSLCIIVLLMDVFVIFSVSNMEYRLNAMDISLQKVLGYSLFERNKRIIVFNGISDIVLLAVLCIVGGVMKTYSAGLCFVVGTLVLLIEMAIMIYNIIKIENENVYKVLKGGCL
nr:DUF1430 domain-containing protein [Lachnospiraceae bacterium]